MPNSFAYIVFFSWPCILFWMLIKFPKNQTVLTATTISILFLPASFDIDLPLLPPLNKVTLTSLSLILILFLLGRKLKVDKSGLVMKLVICYFITIVISSILNDAPIYIGGGKFLPALGVYDAFSNVVQNFILFLPFLIGRYYLKDTNETENIFKFLVLLALVYSLPMLFEFRFSPQLHRMFYGYHASDFNQQMREGGFRASVFVGHGLTLTFIISTCIIAALTLHKNKIRIAILPNFIIILYLLIILFLCKTWSGVIYVCFASIFIFRLAPVKQAKWALILAAFVLLYPAGKILQIIPDKEIIQEINQYNGDRGQSLEFRFQNEEILLARALERPFFGWGGWGRNRVYDFTGKDISVTDGMWILQFGCFGVFGFIFYYSIYIATLYVATKNIKYIQKRKDQTYFASLIVILSIGLIDSVPNTSMGAMHIMLAGMLLGQSEFINRQKINSINERRISKGS